MSPRRSIVPASAMLAAGLSMAATPCAQNRAVMARVLKVLLAAV